MRLTTHFHPAPLLRMTAAKRSFPKHNFAASTGTTATFTIREQTRPVVPVRTPHKAQVHYYVVEGE